VFGCGVLYCVGWGVFFFGLLLLVGVFGLLIVVLVVAVVGVGFFLVVVFIGGFLWEWGCFVIGLDWGWLGLCFFFFGFTLAMFCFWVRGFLGVIWRCGLVLFGVVYCFGFDVVLWGSFVFCCMFVFLF